MVFKSWQIESTDSKLAELLHTGLQSVMDPELGLNIIQLGLVRNVEILEDKAQVTMIFTTPFCPYAPQLMETCRSTTQLRWVGKFGTDHSWRRELWIGDCTDSIFPQIEID